MMMKWKKRPTIDWNEKMSTIDWKWNGRSSLSDYPIICLSIWLLIQKCWLSIIGNERPSRTSLKGSAENAVLFLSDPAGWSAFCAAKDIENIVPVYLSVGLSDYRMKNADYRLKRKMPFLSTVHVLPFPSTIEVLDACVNQYQYWSEKECSRGKDVLTFQSQFARLRDQSTTHFIRNTVSLFCCGVSWQQNHPGQWSPS